MLRRLFFTTLCVAGVAGGATAGVRPEPQSITASGDASLRQWDTDVNTMLRDGRLDIVRSDDDTMIAGRRHERLGQRYEGLPVFGGEVVRQLDGSAVRTVFGQLYTSVQAPTRPVVEADAARETARASVADTAVTEAGAVLGILPTDAGYALVWRFGVRSPRDIRTVYVNAITGAVELSETRIRTQVATGAVGQGTGVFGDNKKISTDRGSGGYEARDRLRPARIETFDFGGDEGTLVDFLVGDVIAPADIARDSDNVWSDGVTVDAHVYTGWTYDFYYKMFGRKGMDDRNLAMEGIVHPLRRSAIGQYDDSVIGQFYNNAGYYGNGHMLFGDGDGTAFDYLAGGFDVTAHELTHGVTDYTSQLIYRNESGALNESFSDIMAVAAEFYFAQQGVAPRPADWLIGEDVIKLAPGYLRSFSNPISGFDPQPDHYSLLQFIGTNIDNGGVHINSGIPNHAFYLAVHGGTNRVSGIAVQGVGEANVDRIAKIFYRAFVFFLTPSARFHDARLATLQAATELYGASSNELQQVQRAWDAVGVR